MRITWDDECCRPVTLPQTRVDFLLRGYTCRWILIVGGGILQVPAVEAAHDLGYKVVVTDWNPECVCAKLADHFEQISTFDTEEHVRYVQKSWQEKTGVPLAAVFTAGADPIVTVARAAEAAGCHGLPVHIAETCADKTKTRNALDGLGLQPEWGVIPTMKEAYLGIRKKEDYIAMGAAKIMSFTKRAGKSGYIVKATGSSGSRGHTRGTAEDFQSEEFCADAYALARKFSNARDVLVEELLTGIELSVETLWYDGTMIPLNAVERPFRAGTNIELGHYNPAMLEPETWKQVWAVMQQAGDAIGMCDTVGGHIIKGDLILTDDGPKVLELTARLSGGFDSGWTSPLAHGVNYTRGALKLALGWPLHEALPDFAPRWHRHAACLAVFAEPGIVKAIHGVEKASVYPACNGEKKPVDVILRYDVSDTVPELVDCTQRAAFVIAGADSRREAFNMAKWARDAIEYEVE